jgi:methyl-accepting chemotaxis protein
MEPIDNSNIDGRLAAIAMNLELLSRDREDDKRRIDALLKAGETTERQIRALFALAEEGIKETDKLTATIERNAAAIERNAEAIARNAEAIARNAEAIARNTEASAQSSEDVRSLARHAIETGDLIRAIAKETDARLRRLEDKP